MKIMHLSDIIKNSAADPNKSNSIAITDENDGATKVAARLMMIPPKAPRMKLHYHTHREGWILILTGEGKEVVDGKEYPIKANDLLFVPAKEKHRIENTGNTELKALELFSLPHDFIEVE